MVNNLSQDLGFHRTHLKTAAFGASIQSANFRSFSGQFIRLQLQCKPNKHPSQ